MPFMGVIIRFSIEKTFLCLYHLYIAKIKVNLSQNSMWNEII